MTKPHETIKITDWLTAAFTAVMMVTAVAAYFLARNQLNQDREEAQTERLLNLVKQYDDDPLASDRKGYAQKRLDGVTEPPEQYRLLEFFENVGLLVDHHSLDTEDVWNDFSYYIFPLYADSKNAIAEEQRDDDPNDYAHFLRLYEEMREISKMHGSDANESDAEHIKTYWKDESTIVAGVPTRPRRSKTK